MPRAKRERSRKRFMAGRGKGPFIWILGSGRTVGAMMKAEIVIPALGRVRQNEGAAKGKADCPQSAAETLVMCERLFGEIEANRPATTAL